MAVFRVPKSGRFAKNPRGFKPFVDTLSPSIGAYGPVLMRKIYAIMRDYAQEMEQYMKDNAPWEDNTGEARDGLTAVLQEHPVAPTIYLYHTATYGKWLEIRWNGLYAIILPTIEDMGPGLIRALEGV